MERIPDAFWEESSFTDLWFHAGLPLTRSRGHQHFRGRRDILLLIAECCPPFEWKLRSFQNAQEVLLDDVGFMTDVMRHEPRLFEIASERIRNNNLELAMMALSRPLVVNHCRDVIAAVTQAVVKGRGRFRYYTPSLILSAETMEALRVRAEDELMKFNNFKLFLCGLCTVGRDSIQHQLMSKLVGYKELKMLIGEFVGYPRSRRLRNNMQAALENLATGQDDNVEPNN